MIDVVTYAWLKKYVDKATAGAGGITPGGEWSSDKSYKKGTVVSANNKVYIAIQDIPVGTELTNTAYWSVLMENDTSADKTFEYQQTKATTEWLIVHNLNKYPSVTITDALGNVLSGDVQYIDSNQLKITLQTPYNGWAYLN